MDEALREAFLEDVAKAVRYWEGWASQKFASSTDAPSDVAREAVPGVVHSILVSIDGGTALSDHGRQVWLTNAAGESVAEGLHEYLFDHLTDAP